MFVALAQHCIQSNEVRNLYSSLFKVASNYNVDSNMKSSNYIKIQFKALIYFELEQTLN